MFVKKILKIYSCPVCKKRHHSRIEQNVDTNMRAHFPDTYAKGHLICNDCLPVRLEQIKKQ